MSEPESHRKKIRQAIVSVLKGPDAVPHPTVAGNRIFPGRMVPAWSDELPLILVYTSDESSEVFDESPRRYKRTVRIRIEALIEMNDGADDALDELAERIERVLFLDPTFDGLVEDSVLSGSEIELDAEGEKLIGVLTMNVEITYYKEMPSADQFTDLSDFSKMDVQVDLAPADGAIEAEDSVSIPNS